MSTQAEAQKNTIDDGKFEARHEKELSVKRFAYVEGIHTLVPLAAMGIGGVIGYFTLGKPLSKIFPSLSRIAGDAETIVRGLKQLSSEQKTEALGMISNGKNLREVSEHFNVVINEVPTAARYVGGAITGFIASIGGGIAVGYDKWRKEESTRLAAEEVNRDIAKLELFRPSDPELVAENKRLRAMLADAPTHKTHAAHHEGKLHAAPEKHLV